MTPWPPTPPAANPRSGWWWVAGGLTGVVLVTVAVLVVVLMSGGDAPSAAPPTIPPIDAPVDGEPWSRAPATSPPSATSLPTSPVPSATPTTPAADLGGLRPQLTAPAARDLLAALPVAADVPTGYERDDFGTSWADVDGNGCNQRDDVLLRDVTAGTERTAQQGSCDHDVLAGQWYDPYTGTVLTFDDMKEPQQAEALQIDHVVPLAEAHRSGAYAWTPDEKEQFANDLDNLVAVGGAVNSSKGDADPGGWLPPAAVQCAYVETWVSIKTRWSLTVDAAESNAIGRVLDGC